MHNDNLVRYGSNADAPSLLDGYCMVQRAVVVRISMMYHCVCEMYIRAVSVAFRSLRAVPIAEFMLYF